MKFSLRRQSTGKLYPYIEILSHTMYWGFFRKVHLHHISGVPTDKPVLLAANHPTAFVDPCLLCSYLHPPIYNMTRGDIFRKPFFRKLMEGVNMFPVYRARDGYSGRDRNDEVFDFCVEKLYQRRVVTIYVEGEHHLEKRVRPAHKGIARIAFAAFEQHNLEDLLVIPAGCNYVYGDRPRDEVMVTIGEPILVRDYWGEYQSDPGAAIQRLCNDIERALKTVCFHVENPIDDTLAEQLLELHRSNFPQPALPVVTHHNQRFFHEKAVLERLNALSDDSKRVLQEQADRYFDSLKEHGIIDAALMNPGRAHPAWLLFFAAGLLPFLVGYAGSWPFIRLAKWLADKKVTKREFYSSVRMGAGFLIGTLYYFILLLICCTTLRPQWIALGLSLPALGWFAEMYREAWMRWTSARRAQRCKERDRLLELRGQIDFSWPGV